MTDPSVDNGFRTGRDTGKAGKFAVAGTAGGTCSVPSSLGGLRGEKAKTYLVQQTDDHIP